MSAGTVFIDPGHGGSDPGAVSRGVREKDIALATAERIGHFVRLLSCNEFDEPRIFTEFSRETDVYVGIDSRALLACRAKAGLFLSIHCNASLNILAQGCEVLVSQTGAFQAKSNLVASEMCARLGAIGLKNRGVHPDKKPWIRYNSLGVLRGTCWHMPGLLLELGFLSNTHDRLLLSDPGSLEVIAIQIAAGVCDAFKVEPRLELI